MSKRYQPADPYQRLDARLELPTTFGDSDVFKDKKRMGMIHGFVLDQDGILNVEGDIGMVRTSPQMVEQVGFDAFYRLTIEIDGMRWMPSSRKGRYKWDVFNKISMVSFERIALQYSNPNARGFDKFKPQPFFKSVESQIKLKQDRIMRLYDSWIIGRRIDLEMD